MLSLIEFDLPLIAVAIAIGIVTARWMFRRPAPPKPADKSAP